MTQGSDTIAQLITDIQTQGWDAQPFDRVLEITLNQPELLPELVGAIVTGIPRGGTYLDTALSFLHVSDYPAAVEQALDTFESNRENRAAESVVESAGLQCVDALHPHLRRIFESHINAACMAANWPWRGSGTQDLQGLLDTVADTSVPDEIRTRSWQALLETRDPVCMANTLAVADHVPFPNSSSRFGYDRIAHQLHTVGYENTREGITQLYSDDVFHVQFPNGYIDNDSRPLWLQTTFHPSWLQGTDVSAEMLFGGTLHDVHGLEANCAICGNGLAHLITVSPIPPHLGITGLASISIATCLSCLGWETEALYYQHDDQGHPRQIYADVEPHEPEFPVADVLKFCKVRLPVSADRWRWQDWGKANGRENMNRVGGHPCWIQSAAYLACPSCHRTMRFVLQLDSNLPTGSGSEYLWGSGGICYVEWCDACKISCLLWQCT